MTIINHTIGQRNERTVIAGDLSGSEKPKDLAQASAQFEAMFLKMMLQQMRKASDAIASEDNPFNSKQQKMLREMHDDTLATHLASQGSVGIADLLVKQLGGKESR